MECFSKKPNFRTAQKITAQHCTHSQVSRQLVKRSHGLIKFKNRKRLFSGTLLVNRTFFSEDIWEMVAYFPEEG